MRCLQIYTLVYATVFFLCFGSQVCARLEIHAPAAENPVGAIVFVHGWYGNPRDTFRNTTASGSSPSWMELIKGDNDKAPDGIMLSQYDVYTLSYDEHRSGSLSLPDLTKRLSFDIERSQLKRYKQIFFVAHSTGGVLLQAVINRIKERSPQLEARIAGIFLIATPSQGFQFGPVIRLMLRILGDPILSIREDDPYIAEIAASWDSYAQVRSGKFPMVFCAIEKEPIPGYGIIVAEKDAFTRCHDGAYPEPKDHIQIVKPKDRTETIYTWVRDSIALVREQLITNEKNQKGLASAEEERKELSKRAQEAEEALRDAERELKEAQRRKREATVAQDEVQKLKSELETAQNELKKAEEKLADIRRQAGVKSESRPDEKLPEPNKSADLAKQRLHRTMMKYVSSRIAIRSKYPENIGKNLGQLYKSGRPPKALVVCLDWQRSTPNNIAALITELDTSTRSELTEAAARELPLDKCNARRLKLGLRCECTLVDVNGTNALDPPEWWIKKHTR